jgi:hypothetical protein
MTISNGATSRWLKELVKDMPVIVVIEGGLGKWQYSDERL